MHKNAKGEQDGWSSGVRLLTVANQVLSHRLQSAICEGDAAVILCLLELYSEGGSIQSKYPGSCRADTIGWQA